MAIERYGKVFPDGINDLDVELWCYRHDERGEGEGGRLTRFEHLRRAADLLWNVEGSSRRVVWNAWTDRMLGAMIEHKYVGLAGAGSSGKSDAAAIFCLIEWLSAPTETMCLLCSSTLAGARGRIWKSVTELWSAVESRWEAEGKMLPGKMVGSKGRIVGMDINGKWSESLGVWLIAAGKDDEAEADKKLKGLKAPSGGALRLVADEFSDLGMCVLTAMLGNLASNSDFKGIGMANPGSKLTPFGKFVTPKLGYQSLNVGDQFWETQFGVCLSFDATCSPRIMEPDGDEKYPWMPSAAYIEQAKIAMGEDSVEYWAQIRGMFCPIGAERTVWSENELLRAMAPVEEDEWDMMPIRVRCAAIDPAFVTDGDRTPAMWAEFGTVKGVKTMNFLGTRILSEGVGADVPEEEAKLSVTENVINQFMELCKYQTIPAKRTGFDGTGGGVVFGQWLHTKWSGACISVRFGEAPIERRADSLNEETIYGNRVTQLWVQPKALVRMGQIRGIPYDVVEELCARRYHKLRNEGKKTYVESKKDMKRRYGKSPDLADTFCILVEVAIQNGLLDIEEIRRQDRRENLAWKERVMGNMGHGRFQNRKSMLVAPVAKKLSTKR